MANLPRRISAPIPGASCEQGSADPALHGEELLGIDVECVPAAGRAARR